MLDKLGYLAAGLGFTSIAASIAAGYTEKTEDEVENAHAERTGIFIGYGRKHFSHWLLYFSSLKKWVTIKKLSISSSD